MVLLIALLLRTRLGLHHHIDERDIDLLGRLLLASALILAYLHAAGWFTAWLGEEGLRAALWTRMTGSFWPFYWSGLVLAVLPPQLFWWRRLRGRDRKSTRLNYSH